MRYTLINPGVGRAAGLDLFAYSVYQLWLQPSWTSALHSGANGAVSPKVSRVLSMLGIAAGHVLHVHIVPALFLVPRS